MWKYLNAEFPVEIQMLVNCRSFSVVFSCSNSLTSPFSDSCHPLLQSPAQQVIFPAPVWFPAIPAPEITTNRTTAAHTASPAPSMEPQLLWGQQPYSDAPVSSRQLLGL